jgi:Ca-activated chloride channel family protein
MLDECAPEERAEVERLLAETPALARERARLERTIGLVRQSFAGEEDALSAEALARVHAAAARRTSAPRWRTQGLAVAAALLMLTGGYATYRVLFDSTNQPHMAGGESAELARRAYRERAGEEPAAETPGALEPGFARTSKELRAELGKRGLIGEELSEQLAQELADDAYPDTFDALDDLARDQLEIRQLENLGYANQPEASGRAGGARKTGETGEPDVALLAHLAEVEQEAEPSGAAAPPAASTTASQAPGLAATPGPPEAPALDPANGLARARGSADRGRGGQDGKSSPEAKLRTRDRTLGHEQRLGEGQSRYGELAELEGLMAGLPVLGGDGDLERLAADGALTAGFFYEKDAEELDRTLEGALELRRQGVPLDLALGALERAEDAARAEDPARAADSAQAEDAGGEGEALDLEDPVQDLPAELAATGAKDERELAPESGAAPDRGEARPRGVDEVTAELEERALEELDPDDGIGWGEDSRPTRYRIDPDRLTDALLAEFRLRPGESPSDMFYRFWGDNAWETTRLDELSTFGVDVDTNSYTLARAYLEDGYLPSPEQIRTEEFVNYFDAGIEPPVDETFSIDLELAPSPFGADPNHWLLRAVVSGRVVPLPERPPLQLTFVVDKSGSMREDGRMGLVQEGMRMLLSNLDERDGLAIVSFDESARLVLPMTTAANQATILESIAGLVPDGSTNAAAGLRLGYAHAADNLRTDGGVNRVVLLSDGVANTGDTDKQEILDSVAKYREQGIYLNTIGVGMDNHNDALLEQLADDGDGVAAYVDDALEARKHLVEDFVQTTVPIARDAKIQVEFDPGQVERYRLLGYENRAIADADFRNDAVDAGELNSGHQVTALYELERLSTGPDPLRPIATARLRWKAPHESGAPEEVAELEAAIGARDAVGTFGGATLGFQRATLVAQFAELLRRSVHARGDTTEALLAQARRLSGTLRDLGQQDPDFDELVALAERAGVLLAAEAENQGELWSALEAVRERAWERAVLERNSAVGADDMFLGGRAEQAAGALDEETRALEQRLRELIQQEVAGE